MSAEAAARLGDEIAHGFGLAAMIAGAVVGAVVGVAIVAATAATGGLAAVIIAGCVAGGGLAMGQIASGLKTIFNLPEPTSGILGMGSPNVFTNMRPAARAVLDFAAGCTGLPLNHFPMAAPVPLAEGSSTVLINGMPASRLKSMLVCGAHVKSASPDVVIGGETARMLPVFDLEGWFKTGLEILGMGALIAGGLFAAAAGFAAAGMFAAAIVGGGLAFEGLGQIGDALGPGYRDLFQGVAGMGLLLAGPKMARGVPVPGARPKGIVFEGRAHRLENPTRVATTFDAHAGNVAANHRYSGPGKGAVYGGTTPETALAEVNHYGAATGRVSASQDVKLNNVLDLTNANTRRQLGVTMEDITGNSYATTHRIGDWARTNGYDGILAPSARNPGGSNIVIFPGGQ